MRFVKSRRPALHATAEIITGLVITWVNLRKAIHSTSDTLTDRIVILIGAMYLVKKGIDGVEDLRERDKISP